MINTFSKATDIRPFDIRPFDGSAALAQADCRTVEWSNGRMVERSNGRSWIRRPAAWEHPIRRPAGAGPLKGHAGGAAGAGDFRKFSEKFDFL